MTRQTQQPTVGAIVLHWRNADDTLRCLASLFASDYPACHVVVVDNSSGDRSIDRIREQYPSLAVLSAPENLGYSGGNNLGMEYWLERGAGYILLLNDDAVLAPTAVSALVAALEADPTAGCAGPKVYAVEEPMRLLSAGGHLHGHQAVHRGMGELDRGQYDIPAEVDYLSGCVLLVRRQAIEEVGMLDCDYYLYREDVDWCYRMQQAGFKLLLAPQARVGHPDTRTRDESSAAVTYYIARNTLLFVRKHRLGWAVMANLLLSSIYLLLNWTLRPCWHHKRPQRNALARATWDFVCGRFGRAQGL